MSNTGTYDSDDHFPVDWNQWHPQWNRWLAEHVDDLKPTSYHFGAEKNFLADEILGAWSVNGRAVELSEVTFTLGGTSRRFIGLTIGAGSLVRSTELVETFSELDRILFA